MCYICLDRNICLAVKGCESAKYSALAWTWYGVGIAKAINLLHERCELPIVHSEKILNFLAVAPNFLSFYQMR